MITTSYVAGVQHALVEAGVLEYQNEKTAADDAAALGGAMEEQGVDQGALAAEGAAPEATHVVAQALQEMAQQAGSQAEVARAKAEIVQNAIGALGESGAMKMASAPAANNVVAGHAPGRVAPGESVASKTDLKKRLATKINDDEHRSTGFSPMPGKTSLKSPMVGTEKARADAEGKSTQVGNQKSLANRIPDDANRSTGYGKPGHTGLKAPMIGTEKKAGETLSDYLKRI